ncbi:hypothetical protein U2G91_15530 [Rhodococcoides fascians]|uniref:SGNH/GDSL hydrolase family protein n=1 Tax=Rhodococcoides fascians TaxID=1828 RepID=UPI002ACDEF7C|nr:hypothetical protein [Rhodococcus fascians]WQH26514.1 hypothetical protein U2G91_15530 [Rhodococcus fascians]
MKSIVTALVDPSGAADYGPDAYVEIWSQLPVGAGGTIATDKPLRVSVTASGLSTDPIRPGNYLIRMKLSTNRTALGPYPFTMPDGDGTTELWPLIAAGVNIPGDTPIQKIQEALAAYLVANPIEGSGLDQTAVDTRVQTVGDTRYAPVSLADDVAGKLAKTDADVAYSPGAVPSDITGVHPGGYDRGLNVYNLKPKHLFRTRAKLAAADAGLGYCRIAAVGDSLTAGDKATLVGLDSWPVAFRKAMAASAHPIAGTGLVLAHYADTGQDARWTKSGAWSVFTANGNRTTLYQAGAGAFLTLASDVAGTSVDVYYSNLSAAFTVQVDGGAPLTVTPAGGGTIGTFTVNGLADTAHTVKITAGGTLYLAGVQVRKASGLLVSTLGLGGAKATDIRAEDVDYGLMKVAVNQVTPDLVTLGLMTNEALTSVPVATYKAAMQVLIDNFKTASDVILVAAPVSSLTLTPYRIALYELADSNDLPLVDNFNRWTSVAVANTYGLMFTDNVHLTTKGYAEIARSMFDAFGFGQGPQVQLPDRLSQAALDTAAAVSAARTFSGFPCGDNTRAVGSSAAPNKTTPQTSRVNHTIGFDTQSIQFVYTNSYSDVASKADLDNVNPITVTASVELAGVIYRLTFGGRTTVTIDPGGYAVTDPLPVSLAKGTVIYSRTYVTGTTWQWNMLSFNFSGSLAGGSNAADLTAPGSGAIAVAPGYFYVPAAVLGRPNARSPFVSVIGVGDSIMAGQDDGGSYASYGIGDPMIYGAGGYPARIVHGKGGFINAGLSADTAANFGTIAGSVRRLLLATAATHMFCEYGRNDLASGTLATAQAALIAVWLYGARRGLKVLQPTITPQSSSTDGYTTVAGQAVSDGTIEARRIALNTWLRAGAPLNPATLVATAVGAAGSVTAGQAGHPLSAYTSVTPVMEVADACETARNSGIWKVDSPRTFSASVTTGTSTVTGSGFTAADVGRTLWIPGAGAAGAAYAAQVNVVSSATEVILSQPAGTTVSGVTAKMAGAMTKDGLHLLPFGATIAAAAVDANLF